MAAIGLFIFLLLGHASADNVTTSFIIPEGLFYQGNIWQSIPVQTFLGVSSTNDSVTYYTVDCGSNDSDDFWPGTYGCDENNSYTFSEETSVTQYQIPTRDLGQDPLPNRTETPYILQHFNQTVTIDCSNTDTATCTYYYLYNKESTTDASIISSTLVSRSFAELNTAFYPMIFTPPSAAASASAAATPSNTLAASTTNPAKPTPTPTNPTPLTNSSSSSSSSSTTPSSPAKTTLTPASKAGIGIGVSLGSILLASLALLLYRLHRKHHRHSRLRTSAGGFVPPGSFAGESIERKHEDVVADTSGVHEMEGRKTPEQGGLYEMQGS